MKKLKFIILMLTLTLTIQNCSTIEKGFSSQKKNSTDEFLVEKKSPLVMPPEFNELPEPKISNTEEKTDDLPPWRRTTNSTETNELDNETNEDEGRMIDLPFGLFDD